MAFRPDIIAGKAVIVVSLQNQVEGQLRGLRTQLRRFSNGLGDLGGDLFRGGLIGTIGAALPIKDFINFQDQLLFVQTKLQVTDKEMTGLEKVIRDLGKSTSFTSKEVADSAQQLAQAGFTLQEVKDTLQASLDLARGGQVALTTSTTILSNALRTFQKDASNAEAFASKFITAARLGTLDIVDLAESLKYSAGTFANFGLELDDVLGMITTLANSGLKASLAGTSLNTAFLNLGSNADKLNELLGVKLADEDFKRPIVALRKLEEGLRKFSKIKQAGILQDLVNIRGGRAIQGLLLQGLDKLDSNIQQIKGSLDEARTSADKLDSRLGGVFRRALSAAQEFSLSIGQTTEGPLTRLGEAAAGTFNSFSNLIQASPEVAQTILLIPPAALAAGTALIGLSFAFNKVASILTPLISLTNLFFTTIAKIAALNLIGISKVTKAFSDTKFLKGSFNPSIDIVKPFIILGQELEQIAESRVLKRLRDDVINLTKSTGAVSKLSNVIRTVATANITPNLFTSKVLQKNLENGLKVSAKNFNVQPIAKGVAKQLELGLQQELDFGNILGKNKPGIADFLLFPESVQRSSTGKILAKNIQDQIQELVLNLRGLKLYKESPLQTVLEDAFTSFDLSDRAKKTFRFNILNNLRESLPTAREIQLPFKDLPKQLELNLFGDNTDGAIGKVIQGRGGKGAFATRQAAIQDIVAAKIPKKNAFTDFFISLGKTSKEVFGNMPRAFVTAFKSITSFGGGIAKLFTGLGGVAKSLFNVNYLAKIISGFKSLGSIIGLFSVKLFKLGKFAFSFGGITTALQFIILFGDKIPFIKSGLEALGKAFNAAFGEIGSIASDLKPVFTLLKSGFQEIFAGNGEGGFTTIGNAFSYAADIISTRLTRAWKAFLKEIEPAANIIKEIFVGTVSVIEALVTTVASVFGTVLKNGSILIKGDGTLLETIKQAFSIENIRSFFGQVIGFITSIGQSLNSVLGAVAEVLNLSKQGIIAVLQALGAVGNKQAQAAVDNLDTNSPRRKQLEDAKIGIRNNAELAIAREKDKLKNKPYSLSLTDPIAKEVNDAIITITAKMEADLIQAERELATLGPTFGTFSFNVEEANRLLKEANDKLIEQLNNAGKIDTTAPNVTGLPASEGVTQGKKLGALLSPITSGIGNFFSNLAKTESPIAAKIRELTAQTQIPNPRFGDTAGASQFLANPLAQREIERLKGLPDPGGSGFKSVVYTTNIYDGPLSDSYSDEYIKEAGAGLVERVRQRKLEKDKAISDSLAAEKVLGPAAFGLGAAIGNATIGLTDFVGGLFNNEEQVATLTEGLAQQIQAQQNSIARIVDAKVGSFSDTRGNLISIVAKSEKLDEDRNKLLETIAANTEGNDEATFP